MKSPTSGREMELKTEKRILEYHGQRFTIDYSFYWCDVANDEFVRINRIVRDSPKCI